MIAQDGTLDTIELNLKIAMASSFFSLGVFKEHSSVRRSAQKCAGVRRSAQECAGGQERT